MTQSLYADGGVIGVNPSPVGGTWAWRLVDDLSGRVLREASGHILCGDETGWYRVTNNVTEFLALVEGLEGLPDGWSGRVCSDSQVTLGRVFGSWKLTGIPTWLVLRGSAAVQRLGHVQHVLLDGHPTREQLAAGIGKRGHLVSEHNVACDAACGREARQARLILAGRSA